MEAGNPTFTLTESMPSPSSKRLRPFMDLNICFVTLVNVNALLNNTVKTQ